MSDLRKAAEMALEAMVSFSTGTNKIFEGEFVEEIQTLRQALAQPEWARLTDDEIWLWFQENTVLNKESATRIYQAIEAKLKEKNT